ncbi:hypothetical protein V865_001878 [Kwoniella europaea PYCC6329]|uniref:BRCT domain-containing protein n=1 Tax=Kwoniella europaea PYCC6329 TaxID=1423913 RepID=A0AAX4KBI3_9TREE
MAYQPRIDPATGHSFYSRGESRAQICRDNTKGRLLFRNERFYVHGRDVERMNVERYIGNRAGGTIVSRSSCNFIIVSHQPIYARSFAESLPRELGEKVIRFEWIRDSVEKGVIQSRKTYWAVPREDLDAVYQSGPNNHVTQDSPNLVRHLDINRSWGHKRGDDGFGQNGESRSEMDNGWKDRSEKDSYDCIRSTSSNTPQGFNLRNNDPKSIFRHRFIWVVGAPDQHRYLENLLMFHGGLKSHNLTSATQVVFYPPNRGFEESTKNDHIRGENLYGKGVRCLTYRWVEDCVKAQRLLDEEDYVVEKKDLFDNDFWRRVRERRLEDVQSCRDADSGLSTETHQCENENGRESCFGDQHQEVVGSDDPKSNIHPDQVASLLRQLTARVGTVIEAAQSQIRDTAPAQIPSKFSYSGHGSIDGQLPADLVADRYPTPISPVRESSYQFSKLWSGFTNSDGFAMNNGEGALQGGSLDVTQLQALTTPRQSISSSGSQNKGIYQPLTGKLIWVVGPGSARDTLHPKITQLGGSLSTRLPSSTIVVFCRSAAKPFIMPRLRDFERATESDCLIVAESWIHDLYFVKTYIVPKTYLIKGPELLSNVQLWDKIIPWTRTRADDQRHIGEGDKHSEPWQKYVGAEHRDNCHRSTKEEQVRGQSIPAAEQEERREPTGASYTHVEPQHIARDPMGLAVLERSIQGDCVPLSLQPLALDPRRAPKPPLPNCHDTQAASTRLPAKIDGPLPEERTEIDGLVVPAPTTVHEQDDSDDYADLAGIFSSDAEEDETDREKSDLTPAPAVKNEASSNVPVKRGRGRPKGTFKKRSRLSDGTKTQTKGKARSKALTNEEVDYINEMAELGDEDSDDSDYTPVKRRKSNTRNAFGISTSKSGSSSTTNYQVSMGANDERGTATVYRYTEALPKDKKRFDELMADLRTKVENNDFPDGLRKYLATLPGATYIYRKYRNLFRGTLPRLPQGAVQRYPYDPSPAKGR